MILNQKLQIHQTVNKPINKINIQIPEKDDKLNYESTLLTYTKNTPPSGCNAHKDVWLQINSKIQKTVEQKMGNTKSSHLHKEMSDLYCLKTSNKLNHREQVTTSRIRIGHSKSTYIHILNESHPTICESFNVQLTTKHKIQYCQKIRTTEKIYPGRKKQT